jgi:ankyrin repeat protein
MIQPKEMKSNLPVELANGVMSTTSNVWDILESSKNGDLETVKKLVAESPELVYAQYNYTPPIHFAVREGHLSLVKYLLDRGALDPEYITYPFKETLLTVAQDRDYNEIALLLQDYLGHPARCKFKGDNGTIQYDMSQAKQKFQRAVNHNEIKTTEQMLKEHPEFALDDMLSWGEGILMMPANRKNSELIELLMRYGAKVPDISKWGRAYYFKHYDIAASLLEKGMNPNHMTWHSVTLLHDMAQEGDLQKASLLIKYGAEINPIEEEYQSTPLGLSAKWGQTEMVKYLLAQGADPEKAGAPWATPLSWVKKKGHIEIEEILINAGAT